VKYLKKRLTHILKKKQTKMASKQSDEQSIVEQKVHEAAVRFTLT
jgi:hypothetical protein